jgi:hypothetical protein
MTIKTKNHNRLAFCSFTIWSNGHISNQKIIIHLSLVFMNIQVPLNLKMETIIWVFKPSSSQLIVPGQMTSLYE